MGCQRSAISSQQSAGRGRRVRDFRQLAVWQKCHLLTLSVYQVTATFPREELLLSHDLGFFQDSDYERLQEHTTEVKRMLAAFIQKLRADR